MPTPVIACGLYLLNLQCPDCGGVVEVSIYLDTRRTRDAGGVQLAAKASSKATDHQCGQLRLVPAPTPTEDPEQLGFFREPDHQERAAGDMT